MATNRTLSERLLSAAISKSVSEKLGSLKREIGDTMKDASMTAEEKKAASLMLLDMVKEACDDFYAKMRARVESGK
jgi:hypothetical protein